MRRRFDAGASGTATVRAESYLVDQLVRALYDHVGVYVSLEAEIERRGDLLVMRIDPATIELL